MLSYEKVLSLAGAGFRFFAGESWLGLSSAVCRGSPPKAEEAVSKLPTKNDIKLFDIYKSLIVSPIRNELFYICHEFGGFDTASEFTGLHWVL